MGRGWFKLPLRTNRNFISKELMRGKLAGVKLELMVDNGATPMKVDNGRRK